MFLGEILSAADYSQDNLYIEFAMRYDPQVWALDSEVSSLGWEQVGEEPGLLIGVTQMSKVGGSPSSFPFSSPFSFPFFLSITYHEHAPPHLSLHPPSFIPLYTGPLVPP